MAKKKKKTVSTPITSDATSNAVQPVPANSNASATHNSASSLNPEKTNEAKKIPDEPVLAISRNKHWRYISAYHGPWVMVPREILETLALSNFHSPRPRQTHPGVLYDLLKIRALVEEAADLAVRAQNGTASSALGNGEHGLPGGSLGLSYRHGNAKLSPERKYRMRELATQKLAQAYRLDEIAASVATMQSASTLDSVASLVLQRSPENTDAKYVNFFHEKIPSRMMAEWTPLQPLDDIIARAPGHAAPFRTRASTKIFKEDYLGAIQDLTDGLAICRIEQTKHRSTRNQLIPLKVAREEAEKRKVWTKDWMQENKVADIDQPTGMELQLLFQRGNQYLTVACQYIRPALEYFRLASMQQHNTNGVSDPQLENEPSPVATDESIAYKNGLEAREIVRKNAKKALRDYTAFFSQLDYSHASMPPKTEGSFDQDSSSDELEDVWSPHRVIGSDWPNSETGQSSALIRQPLNPQRHEHSPNHQNSQWPSSLPERVVHDMSFLLSASPPADLPPFPSTAPSHRVGPASHSDNLRILAAHDELITYHPLMPETLHALLLTHCLLQTPSTALLRLANNAARLARLADGYPFFSAARFPARADWTKVLSKTNNWIGLSDTWESLCKTPEHPNGLQESAAQNQNQKSPIKRDSKKITNAKEVLREAIREERVVDNESFQLAMEAMEKETSYVEGNDNIQTPTPTGTPIPSGCSTAEPTVRRQVAKDDEYLIGTERAEALAKWVLEAPTVVHGFKPKKSKKKTSSKMNQRPVGCMDATGLQNGIDKTHNQDEPEKDLQ